MEDFHHLLLYVFLFCVAASAGFYLIANTRKLFLFIKPELLRRNVITFLIGFCFFLAIGHLMRDFGNIIRHFGWVHGLFVFTLVVIADVLIPYNIVLLLTENPKFYTPNLLKQQILIFLSIVFSTIVANGILNYWINDSLHFLKYSVVWSFYISGFGALIYIFIRQYDQEKRRKLFEKELEVSRLNEQKTKAELEALHSKINPHFLYNALNSIAELAISDGRKARNMTLSLADLFRYSINYSGNSFSTVKDELETVKLYLEIEKTRFEDKLTYSVKAEEDSLFYLVPRFLFQPLVENAVKHGLKTTGNLTKIRIEVLVRNDSLIIRVYDNGPLFPGDINPGYGLKNIHDKLELLFPGRFQIEMHNHPVKYFEICLQNPPKNETAG